MSCVPRPSPSPTGCSAAWRRPRTWSRRRCCACTRALEEGEPIESPRAYVATVATRLAIDQLRSARVRRETYVGEWLPEPLVTDPAEDPARHAEMADSLSLAFLVLLESLSPEQRAVLLLHDVFDYGYDEVARIVGKSEDNARQLAVRARRHVERAASRASRPRARSATSSPTASSPLRRTATSPRSSRCSPTTSCCTATAAARCRRSRARCTAATEWRARCWRGRGRARASPASRCAGSRSTASRARWCSTADGGVISVMALDIADGQVQSVRSIVNPDKLAHLGRVADMQALLERRGG